VQSAWCSRESWLLVGALAISGVSCGKRGPAPDVIPNQPTTASFVAHGCEIRAALTPDKTRFTLEEAVYVTFRVTTDCKEKMTIGQVAIGGAFGRNDAFSLDAVTSSGDSLSSISTPPGEYGAASSRATFTKDEPYVVRLLISHWVKFPAPGRYELRLNHQLDVGAVVADARNETWHKVKVAAPVEVTD
jgi:hypothetical protein